jgi:Osmosensitive K+ channel His kinase sensor domain
MSKSSPDPNRPERGALRIFLGYAAGVGKTYAMLEEAQRRKATGVDIAIGYFEPHGRKDTIEKTQGLWRRFSCGLFVTAAQTSRKWTRRRFSRGIRRSV